MYFQFPASLSHEQLPPPQSRQGPVPSPQGSLELPFYNHTHLPSMLYPHHPQAPGNHRFLLHLYSLVILKVLCKWNHTVCSLLGLGFVLSIIPSSFIQSIVCIKSFLYFSLLLARIPWYGCNTICLTIHLLKDMCFVSSFGDIINKSAMSIHVQVFVWT